MRKQTLALLALFVSLAAAAVMVLREQPERGMVRLDLTHTDLTRVDSIVTSRDNQETVLKRDGDHWLLANGHRADAALVGHLLRDVGTVNTSDFITGDTGRFEDLQVEGAKAVRLRLARGSRTVTDLRLGEANTPGTTYIRQGDRVFRAQAMGLAGMHRDVDAWEDRSLFAEGADEIEDIDITLGGKQTLHVRLADGAWAPAADAALPTDLRFDPGQAQGLSQQLGGLRAAKLIDQDPGDAITHLALPDADRVAWQLSPEAARKHGREGGALVIGAWLAAAAGEEPHERYVRVANNPQLYAVLDRDLGGLRRSWHDMRSLTIMAKTDYDSLRRATFQPAGKAAYSFELGADGHWAPSRASKLGRTYQVDEGKLRQRLHQVLLARAISVGQGSGKKYGLGTKTTEQIVLTDDKGVSHTLTFGRAMQPQEGVGVWAQGDADGLVYGVSRALHDSMLGDAESLRKTAPKGASGPASFSGAEGITPEMEAQIRRQLAASNPG